MLDEAAVFKVLLPARNYLTALTELRTCEVAVSERLFEFLPRLGVIGRLPRLDLLGDRRQFIA